MSSRPLRRRVFSFLGALLILLLAVAVFLFLIKTRPAPPAKPLAEKTWVVNAVEANPTTLAPQITLYGQVESPRASELSAAINADVLTLQTAEGDSVTKNSLLIELDPREVALIVERREAELLDIKARTETEISAHRSNLRALAIEKELLAISARAVERFEELQGRQVSSQTQLDEARRNYHQQALAINNRQAEIDQHPSRLQQLQAQARQAQSQLDSARLDLTRSEIRAPFTGRIAEIQVAPGDRVRSGDVLLMMYDTDALEVRAQIPTKHLEAVRTALARGEALEARANLDGFTLELTLDRLAAQVGGGRAGIDGLFSLTSSSLIPELGRTLELTLTLPAVENVLALPPRALYGTDRVYRIRDGRLDPVRVQRIGERRIQDDAQILLHAEAVSPGDLIVTTQLPNAIAGLNVRRAEP